MSNDDKPIRITKSLTRNELGLTGSHQAGVLVPKSSQLHGYLAELDELEMNPSAIVEFECPQLGRVISARYVHYNSRLLGRGTRDEYRLTRLGDFLSQVRARPGDLLVFTFNSGACLRESSGETKRSISIETPIEASSGPRWTVEEISFDPNE